MDRSDPPSDPGGRTGSGRQSGSGPGRPRERYHHGDLRAALVGAAEEILGEKGVEGFTLREAARRIGVSPAAPAHHFGDVAGLLTEVAILGFEELTRRLEEGNRRGGADPEARLREQGVGYVGFALAYPARFQLMFRNGRLRTEDPRLKTAGRAAFATLESTIREITGLGPDRPLDAPGLAGVLGAWSMVHGFAQLALEGEFDGLAGEDGRDAFLRSMLPEVLALLSVPAGRRDPGGKGG
ncbi:TetR/AcrR family transcriptional regulator [Arenibaculum pallidiluteum]|uniref:TetR/AcrR family transcriptional regulator n=1 Tax=Arenibaculum pallidiluteum TaxID=2812559 RepID=UPI001A973624|nr:TetR/AcrR family transcriptional regulator [Arenibaculum pallidiluteum]